MASANLSAASPQVVSWLTTIDILNSGSAKSGVGIVPSARIRRNVGPKLIRAFKDVLNVATMSRKQDIAITNIILSFGQIMLVSQKSLVMILERCAAAVSTGLLHCTWSAYGPKQTS